MHKYKFSIVACARWETVNVIEWIEYYKHLGVDHIYIYSNDDDANDLLRVLFPYLQGESPYVTYRHFPFTGQQWAIYRHYLLNYAHETAWCSFLDIDEFLNLRGATLKEFLLRYGYADCIYLNWLNFGNSNHDDRPQGPVLSNYNRRQRQVHFYTKNIFRTASIDIAEVTDIENKEYFWHGWTNYKNFCLNIVNVLHDDMADYYSNFPDSAIKYLTEEKKDKILEAACVFHYSTKSKADFIRRVSRGVFGDFAGQMQWGTLDDNEIEVFLAHSNEIQDNSLVDFWERTLNIPVLDCIPASSHKLISTGKIARASSTSEWSLSQDPEMDASKALSGIVTGRSSFHTAYEFQPWLSIDLAGLYNVREIRIFNRIDQKGVAARAFGLTIMLSEDGINFTSCFQHDARTPFGGADGNPLIATLSPGALATTVKIQLPNDGFLHLDQVFVYSD